MSMVSAHFFPVRLWHIRKINNFSDSLQPDSKLKYTKITISLAQFVSSIQPTYVNSSTARSECSFNKKLFLTSNILLIGFFNQRTQRWKIGVIEIF